MLYIYMARDNSQLSRWNFLSFFYFIKQRDQIVNLWNYVWFSLKNFFVVIILRIVLTFIITYFACPVWGNFFSVNTQKMNNNNTKIVFQMTNLENFILRTDRYANNIQNKPVLQKISVFNNKKLNTNNNKVNIILDKNQEKSCPVCAKIVSLRNNIYYKTFLMSLYSYGGFSMNNTYIFFINVTLLISLFIGYIFGFLPNNENPGKLFHTELSWWNPLSIWYGFKKRLMFDSVSSRVFWVLFYIINFFNLGYNVYFYGNSFVSIMQTIIWLTSCYTWPRWYSKDLNKSY